MTRPRLAPVSRMTLEQALDALGTIANLSARERKLLVARINHLMRSYRRTR